MIRICCRGTNLYSNNVLGIKARYKNLARYMLIILIRCGYFIWALLSVKLHPLSHYPLWRSTMVLNVSGKDKTEA